MQFLAIFTGKVVHGNCIYVGHTGLVTEQHAFCAHVQLNLVIDRGSCDELCASILVTGPPGCGKAATVRSVASQLNMHVLSVSDHTKSISALFMALFHIDEKFMNS